MDKIEAMNIFLRFMRSFAANKIPVFFGIFLMVASARAQQAGGIRGTVQDKEFDAPLAAAQVVIAETGGKTTVSDQGSFVFGEVPPGKYTLVFSKDGYTRQVAADVVVAPGQMTDVNASMSGEFTEMDEFVVQDLAIGGGTEAGLLNLRIESPAMMDSVSSDLMSRAGAGDAASALRLVTGATVQDGKYAVVRGLPDRYVNSQMNSVRLPTADADKRAVQLDQFPSEMVESVQVSKTFTPDQQGDASGGAVNVVLKGIPDESVLKFSMGTEYNTQTTGNDDFLTYKGGGVNTWGQDDGGRELPIESSDALFSYSSSKKAQHRAQTELFSDTMGVSRGSAPVNYNWNVTAANKHELNNGLKIGALGSFYYKHDSSFYDKGRNDKYYGTSTPLEANEFQPVVGRNGTALYDVTKGTEEVQWGGLGAVGVEAEDHKVTLLYMQTQAAEDTATLMEDTRGYDEWKGTGKPDYVDLENYIRSEALKYTERTTSTLQLRGQHTLAFPEFGLQDFWVFKRPEIDWTVAKSDSTLWEPDKRLFLTVYDHDTDQQLAAGSENGNAYRSWKEITEASDQYFLNAKVPFEQWSGDEGYFKSGLFNDAVNRTYEQDSFKYDRGSPSWPGSWDEYWSEVYTDDTNRVVLASSTDIDYKGKQDIKAFYYMADIPLWSQLNVIGGMRHEFTGLEIKNTFSGGKTKRRIITEDPATGAPRWEEVTAAELPGKADVSLEQDDVLPSLGLVFKPVKPLTFRGAVSRTVARPTFKELSPLEQMEYLGADTFVGNPDLKMSSVKNYDLRGEYIPVEGSLFAMSWFRKDIKDPIEYYQAYNASYFTRPANYPEGWLEGIELEARQELGRLWSSIDGFSVGANATFIKSEVTMLESHRGVGGGPKLPETRDMLNAPEHLYNFNFMYDNKDWGTQAGLFYTVTGDTLVSGGSMFGTYNPSVYSKEYGTLTFSLSQKIGKNWKVSFKAKNLLDPQIQEVYRADQLTGPAGTIAEIPGEALKTSYKKGMDFSISLSCEF
jgi:TonB-dependent receptor